MTYTPFDIAFGKVKDLVATFKANEARYLSPDYQEAEARKDFIDKFWIALGWDVNHDVQTNPYEQEVKVERGLSAGGQRRADYAFFLAPDFRDARFFVEAKKPAVQIGTKENHFQVIRYGWNSKTPLAVLTDFEQFHILDCRCKPDISTALDRAVAKYHYSQYSNRDEFARIYWLFSREAVAAGSLEKRAAELREPRGKAAKRSLFPGGSQSIDESFLKELDEHRTALAHAFKDRNPRLDSETLTEITQRTLDRLVFLRFLEDKGIEPHRHMEKFCEKSGAWEHFITASRRLDGIYNGIVFKQHAILDAPNFHVDADAFAGVCNSLSHTNSPYDFNAIPIHILGSIYERFLGKVIVATDKRVRVEDKPEVRKAGGVYYTPEYIVRYIVENTVGKLIAGKSPDKIAEMKFADISCGSGSFLLGIYDLLLRYHGNYYNAHPKKARKGDCIEHDGKRYLSLRKKREILLNNIYGVDIDAQAVEVCQLSLYLKLLQDETTASAHEHQMEFHETLLPPLNKNIVCGNSLIGTDILEGQLFPGDEERKLNPMNFEDAFPEVMKRGGFDAVVGNPPYVFGRDWKALNINDEHKAYFNRKYTASSYQLDMFSLFMERASSLTKFGGRIGQIVPNVWLTNTYSSTTRAFILSRAHDLCIAVPPSDVFAGITVDTVVYTLEKAQRSGDSFDVKAIRDGALEPISTYETAKYLDGHRPISTAITPQSADLAEQIKQQNIELGRIAEITRGVHSYRLGGYGRSAFGSGPQTKRDLAERPYHSPKKKPEYRPFVYGCDLHRFTPPHATEYVKYGPWLAEPRNPEFFCGERVYSRKILADRLVVTVETTDSVADQQVYITKPTPGSLSATFLAGILGSQLIAFFIRSYYDESNQAFPQIKVTQLKALPIPKLNLSDPADKLRHDQMVRLVEVLLEAKKQLAKAKTDKDKTYYENKCAGLDHQIDRLVYDLYGLTNKEIAIVEGHG
ncbi:MAG: N-6 DNA methylase [Candidatus Aureabacteria bacterium]|nr:N-6 DNA methylase [Candidatus Auribacterota bacterium]